MSTLRSCRYHTRGNKLPCIFHYQYQIQLQKYYFITGVWNAQESHKGNEFHPESMQVVTSTFNE